jgi:D-alanine transaminase
METLGYYNGTVGPLDEMKVPMTDRACFFGDGIYDTCLGHNHVVYTMNEHIDRFYRGLAMIGIRPTLTKADLAQILSDCLRRMTRGTYMVYWQMTRGTGPRRHVFPEGVTPNLWVMITPVTLMDLSQKMRLLTVEDTRYFFCHCKTLNILLNCLAAEKAKQAGCYDAVFHRADEVTECSHSNVYILRDGELWTHPTDNLILPGISRAHLITHCRKFGIPVKEQPFTIAQMMDADEVMVSDAETFCLAASHVDGVEVGGRAPQILKTLQDSLMEEFIEATKGD